MFFRDNGPMLGLAAIALSGIVLSGILPTAAGAQALEKPVRLRLYARAADGHCRVPYEAQGTGSKDSLILEVFANGAPAVRFAKPDAAGKIAFAADLAAGLTEYRFALSAKQGANVTLVEKADSVVCGDAYIIYGQSNAEARYGAENYLGADGKPYKNEWIRGYKHEERWHIPDPWQTGVWGMHMSRLLMEKYHIPVGIVNGAKGNTTIRELSPGFTVPADNAEWIQDTKDYGNYYKRLVGWVSEAGLTDKVRGLFWHQGEKNVYGADFTEYKLYDYAQAFLDLKASFYKDFPALKRIFAFQIKTGCGGDDIGWDIIFETQRKLAHDLPDVDITSTLAPDIVGCHYGENKVMGYPKVAAWIFRQLDSAFYGGKYPYPVTPPDLVQAAYTSAKRDEVALLFDQEVQWTDSLVYDPNNQAHNAYFWNSTSNTPRRTGAIYLKSLFAFDSTTVDQVVSGRAEGRKVFLKLKQASAFKKIAYPRYDLPGDWPGPFITGPQNGLGALGFYVKLDSALSPTGLPGTAAVRGPVSRTLPRRFANGRIEFATPAAGTQGGDGVRPAYRDAAGKEGL
jgi:hypothetical protein